MKIQVFPAKEIHGLIKVPGDKSISHRSIIIGSISEGEVDVKNFLYADDCLKTLNAFKKLGVKIKEITKNHILVKGVGLNGLSFPKSEIYLGNSGTSMRLMLGLLAGQSFTTTLSGDKSLSSRPMDRVTKPLTKMGARFQGRGSANYAPIRIKGNKLKAINYKSPIGSAQIKSAVLLAGLYSEGVTSVTEPYKSRDHTEKMLDYFGANIKTEKEKVSLYPTEKLTAKPIVVPGDISSAMYFILAALIVPNSHIVIKNVGINPTRMGAIEILKNMGAIIKIKEIYNNKNSFYEPIADIEVSSSKLKSVSVTKEILPKAIDELPLIMVAGCFAEGTTKIYDASELRVKETDRIESMVINLKKMGANITQEKDNIFIKKSELAGSRLSSYNDHRTAMSLIIASIACRHTESIVDNIKCIDTSFPQFFNLLGQIGVKFDFVK